MTTINNIEELNRALYRVISLNTISFDSLNQNQLISKIDLHNKLVETFFKDEPLPLPNLISTKEERCMIFIY